MYALLNKIRFGYAEDVFFQQIMKYPKQYRIFHTIGGFLYLEVLDASFSFDGVIGAFAITQDVVIIMLGLAIGAIFVRSMTIYLVEKGTLEAYQYLEHGAHYAIGALAIIMVLAMMHIEVPEVITGLIGVAFIVWSVLASISARKKAALV